MSKRRRRLRQHQWLERLEDRVLLAGDLVAHWRAEELLTQLADGDAITQWPDMATGLIASANGTITLAENRMGRRPAVQFDGDAAGTFEVSRNDSPMSQAGDFTIGVVFATSMTNLPGDGSQWFDGRGLVHSNVQGVVRDWGIALHTDGRIGAGVGGGLNGPTRSVFTEQTGFNDGQRHLVVFTRKGSQLTLTVDDHPTVVGDGADDSPRRELDAFFGERSSRRGWFDGDLAEVRIYDGALDAAEITALDAEIDAYYDNEAPQVADDMYTNPEDRILFVPAPGFLANDRDPDGDELTAVVTTPPAHGTLTLLENGSFLYSPQEDFFGDDRFEYAAVDFRPSSTATVTIRMTPVHDGPRGHADIYKLHPTQPITVDASAGVLVNDINVDRRQLTAQLQDDVDHGQLKLRPDGSFDYDPERFSGTARFSYRIDDGVELSEPIVVEFIVNTPPVAVDDLYTLNEDQTLEIDSTRGVRANDRDADANPFELTLVDRPMHGQLELAADGSFVYTPSRDYFGDDQFTYVLNDGIDSSQIGTVQLEISAVNDTPTPIGDTYFVKRDDLLVIHASQGLLANDLDVDDTALSVTNWTRPDQGELEVDADGALRFTPPPGFTGSLDFSYDVRDVAGATATGHARLSVDTTPLRITEISSANNDVLIARTRESAEEDLTDDLLSPDWIEIENRSHLPIDLSGHYLTDDANQLRKWQFPPGTTIAPSELMLVYASRLNILDPALDQDGRLHTNFKLSHRGGENVGLIAPNGEVISQLSDEIPEQFPDISYGINTDGQVGYMVPTPGQRNTDVLKGVVEPVVFSHPRGFYDEAIEVSLDTPTIGASIYYTLDASEPTPATGMLYTQPISIDTTANLRAASFLAGYVASPSRTHTYLFVDSILRQPELPAGLPDRWGPAGAADYEMDARVALDATSPFFDPQVADALRALPTISLTVDQEDFFSPERGLQSFPQRKGDEWEHPTSLELIDFEAFDDVQINAGIRMVGNASRNPNRRKHNMRLTFRDDYGVSELAIPLFGIGPQEAHNNLILRGGNGDSWVNPGTARRAQYIRDQWQRDLQTAMGNLTTQQLYAHLYINGLYWGLYHVFERHDASFMALHLGGDEEDYEAIKDVNGQTHLTEAVSGTTQVWDELLAFVVDTDNTLEDIFEVVNRLIDIDNMIDYLMINFYAGNGDWDHNNFRTGRNKSGKFIFFSWDAERADLNRQNDQGRGDLVINQRDAQFNAITKQNRGRPTRINRELREHPEYNLRVADRIQRHFFNDGALTPAGAAGLWNARADEIRLPLAAESARWGDLHSRNEPKGVAHWEQMLQIMNDQFFSTRTDTVLEQLYNYGFTTFRDYPAPRFSQHGGGIPNNFDLTIEATDQVFFTLDGTDPRQFGGERAATARPYSEPIRLSNDALVKARVLYADGQWSPLSEARFTVMAAPANAESFRVSEVHFNPAPPTAAEEALGFANNDDFEFLEFLNISDQTIDLSDVHLSEVDNEGVEFRFAEGNVTRLGPRQRVVIVEDIDAFRARYGTQPLVAGEWQGRLSNAGETIRLLANDTVLLQFTIDDQWYPAADGLGSSLEIVDVAAADLAAWSTREGWQPSSKTGGTPGTGPIEQAIVGDANHDGVFDEADLIFVAQAGEYDDDIEDNSTFEEGDWNGDGDFDADDLIFAFQLGLYI